MKNKIILSALWGVTLLSGALNFNDYVMGYPASVAGMLVSALYVVVWTAFTIYNRRQGFIIMSMVWGGVTLLVASISCYIAAFDLIGAAIIPFALLFLTPFYGLTAFAPDMAIYGAMIMCSLAWVLISFFTLRASRAGSKVV